jgi:hypothetical protein
MLNLFRKPKIEIFSEDDLEKARSYAEFTPDIALLESRMSQFLFVNDHWQSGHWGHHMIRDYSVPLGTCFTQDYFVMYKHKMGPESWAVPLEDSPYDSPRAPIRGELHAIVPPVRFAELDTDRRNGVIFYRKRVTLVMPYQVEAWFKEGGMKRSEMRYQNIRAWMYVGVPEYWEQRVDKDFFLFNPVQIFEPKNPDLHPYYNFTKLEYQDQ